MKTYLITTALLFALLTLAHVARVVEEGLQLARGPWFVFVMLVSAGMCIWATVLAVRLFLRKPPRT